MRHHALHWPTEPDPVRTVLQPILKAIDALTPVPQGSGESVVLLP
jgi:hypothetical protein